MFLFAPPNVKKLKASLDIKGLIKALRYKKESTIRSQAVEALQDIGGPLVIKSLIDALQDTDQCVSQKAALALQHIGDEHEINLLINRLGQCENAIGPEALVALTNNSDYKVRAYATLLLARQKDSRAFKNLTELKHLSKQYPNEQIFSDAIIALEVMRDYAREKFTEVLENFLRDPATYESTFNTAVTVLKKTFPNWQRGVEQLIDSLNHKVDPAQEGVFYALGLLRLPKSALEPLLSFFITERTDYLQKKTIQLLDKIDTSWRTREDVVARLLGTAAEMTDEKDVHHIREQLDELNPSWATSLAAREVVPTLIQGRLKCHNLLLEILLDIIQENWRTEALLTFLASTDKDPREWEDAQKIVDYLTKRHSYQEAAQRVLPILLAMIEKQSIGWLQALVMLRKLDPERGSLQKSLEYGIQEWHVLALSSSKLRNIDHNWYKSDVAKSASHALTLLLKEATAHHLRYEIVSKLKKIGTSSSIDALANSIINEVKMKPWSEKAAQTLVDHGDSRAIDFLLRCLRNAIPFGYGSRDLPSEVKTIIDMLEKLLTVEVENISIPDLRSISIIEPIEWHVVDEESYAEWADGFNTTVKKIRMTENFSILKELARNEIYRRKK